MHYGVTNLGNYSIQARDVLFTYAQLDKVPYTPETNLVIRFTIVVTFLTPNDPLYQNVITSVLAAKTKAFASVGSKLTNAINYSAPTKNKGTSKVVEIDTSPLDVQTILLGLTSAITELSTKTMTSTEREHACK